MDLIKKAELLASDAKNVGIWNEKESQEFVKKIEEGEITEQLFEIISKDIKDLIDIYEM